MARLFEAESLFSTPDGILTVDGNAIVWSTKGVACGIAITPSHRFNPRAKTEWIEQGAEINVGEKRDLCYKSDGSWSYLGTYDCLSEAIVDIDILPLSERVLLSFSISSQF